MFVLGDILHQKRGSMGLSIKELSQKTGVPMSTISNLERHYRKYISKYPKKILMHYVLFWI